MAALAWKRPWLVTVLEAYGGRLAIEATVEPSSTKGGRLGAENPDEQWGFYRSERGAPYVDRRKKKRKNHRKNAPVQHWRRCGSV
jgi:hypothetical protein